MSYLPGLRAALVEAAERAAVPAEEWRRPAGSAAARERHPRSPRCHVVKQRIPPHPPERDGEPRAGRGERGGGTHGHRGVQAGNHPRLLHATTPGAAKGSRSRRRRSSSDPDTRPRGGLPWGLGVRSRNHRASPVSVGRVSYRNDRRARDRRRLRRRRPLPSAVAELLRQPRLRRHRCERARIRERRPPGRAAAPVGRTPGLRRRLRTRPSRPDLGPQVVRDRSHSADVNRRPRVPGRHAGMYSGLLGPRARSIKYLLPDGSSGAWTW